MALLLTLLAPLILAASDPQLDEADRLRARSDCDGLVLLSSQLKGTDDTVRDLSRARALVQGAELCRKDDPVLALALTDRALLLAPKDYGVATAHAETLLALHQRSEGAALLDATVRAYPEGAVRARFVRATLAEKEEEPARVIALLTPLADDPEYGERSRVLLARSHEALARAHKAREQVRQEEARAKDTAAAIEAASKRPLSPSGTEVWSTRGAVKSGGSRTFRTRGLQEGLSYELIATGKCSRPAKKKKKRRGAPEDSSGSLFGTEFRITFGGQGSRPLKVGFTPETTRILFRAPHDNPQLHLEDRSFQREERNKNRPSCTISGLAVRVP